MKNFYEIRKICEEFIKKNKDLTPLEFSEAISQLFDAFIYIANERGIDLAELEKLKRETYGEHIIK